MKRLLFIVMFIPCMLMAQKPNVEQAFLTIPQDLCPFFDVRTAYQMLNLAKSGVEDSTINFFGGKSRVMMVLPDQITLAVADSITYDVCVTDSSIVYIQTVCVPVCNSIVRRYDSQWHNEVRLYPPFEAPFCKSVFEADTLRWIDTTPKDDIAY